MEEKIYYTIGDVVIINKRISLIINKIQLLETLPHIEIIGDFILEPQEHIAFLKQKLTEYQKTLEEKENYLEALNIDELNKTYEYLAIVPNEDKISKLCYLLELINRVKERGDKNAKSNTR